MQSSSAQMVRPLTRKAFTLVEALVATSITAVAGSALLLGMSNALKTTNNALEQTIAEGLAAQLMDEIAAQKYHDPDREAHGSLGPEPGERAAPGRSLFDDIDDYNGYQSIPATDRYGRKLATEGGGNTSRLAALQAANYFDRWRQQVAVQYVREVNGDLTQTTTQGNSAFYKRVSITISVDDANGQTRQILTVQRIFAYVSPNG